MDKKTTPVFKNLFILLIFNILNHFSTQAQTLIAYQGFDTTPQDVWGYTNTLNTGAIATNTTAFVSSPNSLRIVGSNDVGTGAANNDPFVSFNNVNISTYANNFISVYFSSNGTPDDNDDLYLDVSYNNGVSYATSIKLVDGKNNAAPDTLPYTHAAITGTSVGSPFIFNIPNGNTQVKIRIRFDELDNDRNTSDNYFIDNISLHGTPMGNFITLTGLGNNTVAHNSAASITNGTIFGQTQVASAPIVRNFTIKNIGSNDINLTGTPLVNIIGSSDFSVTILPTTPITTLNSTTFQITFNPSSTGIKSA